MSKLRDDLKTYLESEKLEKAEQITSKTKGGDTTGSVKCDQDELYALIAGKNHKSFRLIFKKGDVLCVNEGSYKIRNMRAVRKDKAGAAWVLSTTKPSGVPLEITKSEETTLTFDPKVQFELRARRLQGGLNINAGMSVNGAGATVFKDGEKVPVKYKIISKDGKELNSGTLTYD